MPRGGDERLGLGRVLEARLGLDPGGHVDAPRAHGGDRVADVLGRQAAGQEQRHLRVALGGQAPVPGAAGAAAGAGRAGGVEQVEVGVEALDLADVGARADPVRLDHAGAGALGDRVAERRPLVSVQLHVREPDPLDRVRDLVERRVHEHPHELEPPPHRARDAGRHGRVGRPLGLRPQDEPDRPRVERGRQLGVLEPRDAAELDVGHGLHPRSVARAPANCGWVGRLVSRPHRSFRRRILPRGRYTPLRQDSMKETGPAGLPASPPSRSSSLSPPGLWPAAPPAAP